MKKTVIFLLVATLLAVQVNAQKETKKFSVGFGLEPGIPVGSISNVYNFAFGFTIRFSYHVGPGFVTLTTGGVGYAPKKFVGTAKVGLQVPVRVGYKYIIQHHLFLMGEVGYSEFKTYYGHSGEVLSNSSGSFIAAPSIGFQANAFEISLRYGINGNNEGGVVGLRIGFNF
jgi:hypothetical protein